MSNQNKLEFVNIEAHPELKLSELEQQLVARNLIFQKIVLLPKTRMNAMKDKTKCAYRAFGRDGNSYNATQNPNWCKIGGGSAEKEAKLPWNSQSTAY